MLCKVTSKNQLTLPGEVLRHCPDQTYFDARWESGRIVLEPVVIRPLESPQLAAIRDKVGSLEITEDDLADIVAEARRSHGYLDPRGPGTPSRHGTHRPRAPE